MSTIHEGQLIRGSIMSGCYLLKLVVVENLFII